LAGNHNLTVKEIIKYLGSHFLKHELISGSVYIFAGSFFGNILAFILNLFLARNLSYSDYGIFMSLLSIITITAIPSGSINTIIVKFATSFFVKEQNNKLKTLYLLSFKFIFGLSMTLFFLFFIFAVPLKNYLRLDNVWYIIASGIVVSLFYLSALNTAFLQSLLKFKFMAFINVVGSVLRLIVGIILVIFGCRAFSGLGALFSMMLGMYLIAYFPLAKILKEKSLNEKIFLDKKQMFSYAVPAFITVLFLTSYISIDVILVKHFFDSRAAGFYSGLSLMGKVIYYFTYPIPLVMFPLLVKRHAKGAEFNNLFYLALILVILPSIIITALYFVFPNFAINLFLGGRDYLYVSKYLGIFGLFITVFSLVNVCVSFFLSLNKTNISIFVILAAFFQILLIYVFHSDFYQVIGVSLLVLVVLLTILLYLFFKNYGNFGKFRKIIAAVNAPEI
jgi:O-antigen/teichoic acid export membrane protein